MALGAPNQLDLAIYDVHPWFEPARQLGYTEFLSPDELEKLRPA
jgi:hypothetical protein